MDVLLQPPNFFVLDRSLLSEKSDITLLFRTFTNVWYSFIFAPSSLLPRNPIYFQSVFPPTTNHCLQGPYPRPLEEVFSLTSMNKEMPSKHSDWELPDPCNNQFSPATNYYMDAVSHLTLIPLIGPKYHAFYFKLIHHYSPLEGELLLFLKDFN